MSWFRGSAARGRHAVALAAAAACIVLAGCSGGSGRSELESGREALEKKDARAAQIHLKAALQENPNSGEARYLLGRALLESNDPRGAMVELTRAMDARFNDDLVLPALARAMLLSGQVKKLTEAYGDIRLKDPAAHADLKVTVANAWGMLGDNARFEAAVKDALAARPDLPAVLVARARMAINGSKHDDALVLLDQAAARDPANYEAWFLRGQVLTYVKRDAAGGEAAYRKAIEIEKAFLPAHAAVIGIHLRANDIAGAKKQAAALREVLPKHPHTVFIDAQLALLDGDVKKAHELSQALLKWSPDSAAVLQLAGAVEAQLGSAVMAETHYAKALQINPELSLARRNLGRLYLQMGQPVRAVRTLEPLVRPDATDAEALALAGDAQLQLGDPRAAEQLFARANRLRPDDVQLRTAAAMFKMARGSTEAAFTELETLASQSKETFADMAIFSARLKRREFDAALKAMDGIIAKQPKNATLQELRGRVLAEKKDLDGARAAYEKALAMEPRLLAATLSLARLDLAQNRGAEGVKRLEAAVAADPRNSFARIALAELRDKTGASLDEVRAVLEDGMKAGPADPSLRNALVDVLLRKKQYKDALAIAQNAAAVFPNDLDTLDQLGRTQALAGEPQQAVATFRKLASLEPASVRGHLRAAEVQNRSGDRDGAIGSLRRALEIEPNHVQAQASLLDLLLVDGKSRDALELARAMQTRQPDSPTGYLFEGAVHIRMKEWDAATAVHRKGLQRLPDRSELAVALHTSLSAANKAAEAQAFAEDWLRRHPDDADFGYRVAVQMLVRGRLDEAEVRFAKLAVQRPNDALVLNNLAWVMATRGKPGAVAHAEKAAALLPNRANVLDTLALALATEKQFPRAIQTQKKAIEIAPGDMHLRLNLAKIALQAGDKALAKAELDRLAELGPKSPLQPEVTRLQKGL